MLGNIGLNSTTCIKGLQNKLHIHQRMESHFTLFSMYLFTTQRNKINFPFRLITLFDNITCFWHNLHMKVLREIVYGSYSKKLYL